MPPAVSPSVPAATTRSRILSLAETLLLERGFNAFSYQHIARELAIKPAAVHYYFPGKDDLGLALIVRQLTRLRKWRGLPRLTDLPPAGQLRALLAVYEDHVAHERRVCLFGALAADFRTLSVPMQQQLQVFNRELTGWLAQVLAAGRAMQEVFFRGDPSAKAVQVLTTLVGALQVARVHDETQFQLILQQLRLELLTPPG